MAKFRAWIVLGVCLGAFGVAPASAQSTQTFMLIPGVPGDAVADRYEGWIDVYSITQTYDSTVRRGNACSLELAKGIDSAGPRLWGAAVTGQVFNQVQIDVRKAGGDPFKFYEIILTSARVGSITSIPNQLAEQLTLIAEAVTLKFTPMGQDGRPQPTIVATVSCR